jgi:catechol 2,3-dioxygenase-like lactoylglutathione lyase family enzyme
MPRKIAHVTLLVRDYDEAINYYTSTLRFKLIDDTQLTESKRWVLVSPDDSKGFALLLAKAANENQIKQIGNQTGGRVFLFLHTDNFDSDFKDLIDKKVKIVRQPSIEVYGKVAVFEDLYGNLWDLVEPNHEM